MGRVELYVHEMILINIEYFWILKTYFSFFNGKIYYLWRNWKYVLLSISPWFYEKLNFGGARGAMKVNSAEKTAHPSNKVIPLYFWKITSFI